MINNKYRFSKTEIESSVGLWKSITLHDLDDDGKNDLILGNHGTNTYLGQYDKLGMIWGDYDNNNVPEPLLYINVNGVNQPLASKDLLVSQMTVFKSLHKDYNAFANDDFDTMFGRVIGKTIVKKEIDELQTSLFRNRKGVSYEKIILPIEAQAAPTFAIQAIDVNSDNVLDLVLGGNLYEVTPNIGRADASYGTILIGSKPGAFSFDKDYNASLLIDGQVRKMSEINVKGVNRILVARNNDTLSLIHI